MKTLLDNNILRIIVCIVAIILAIFMLLLVTVRFRVVGTWQRETVYLPHYWCDAILIEEYDRDGTVNTVVTNAETGKVLHEESGTWSVSGFTVRINGKRPHIFNPITGKMKNGSLYFTKIS